MTAVTAAQRPLDMLLGHFSAAASGKAASSFQDAAVEIGAAPPVTDTETDATAGGLVDDLQLHEFQFRLAQFRQSVSALTEGGAQISGTVGPAGAAGVNIVLTSGASMYFDDLPGNVRFSDTGDGGIEVVTEEFIRIYDQHGRLVSESAGGAPLEGSDGGDVIFNVNGARVSGNGGNDTIFTMPGMVDIDAGDGDDSVYVCSGPGSGNTLNISLGAGDDSFRFIGADTSPTGHTLHVNGGDGNDTITINRGVSGGRIDGGEGDDSILSSELLHDLHISGGSGNDRIFLNGLANGSIDARDGSDMVSIESLFASSVLRHARSSVHIADEYSGDVHGFVRNGAGRWLPSGVGGNGGAHMSIKV